MLVFFAAPPLCIVVYPTWILLVAVFPAYLAYHYYYKDPFKYVGNLFELPEVFENINKAIENKPTFEFKIECWHNEKYKKKVRGPNG